MSRAFIKEGNEAGFDFMLLVSCFAHRFNIPSCCQDAQAFSRAVSDARCVFDMGVSQRSWSHGSNFDLIVPFVP